MSLRRIRQAWPHVEIDPPFAEYVGGASRARKQCLRDVIEKLGAGAIDLVAGFRPNQYFIFACDVTIAVAATSGTVVLGVVTAESEE